MKMLSKKIYLFYYISVINFFILFYRKGSSELLYFSLILLILSNYIQYDAVEKYIKNKIEAKALEKKMIVLNLLVTIVSFIMAFLP